MAVRKTMTVFGVTVVLALSGSVVAEEAEQKIGVDASADFYGKYIWRGQNLNNSTVSQPGVSITYGGLTGSVWGNLDMTDSNDNSGEFTEYDFSLDYSVAVPGAEGLGFSIGAIQYNFPSVNNDTLELYWGFSLDVLLSPSITVYHDVDEANGTYVTFGVGHTFEKVFELSPDMPVALELGASVGWADSGFNEDYWGVDNSKMNDLTLSMALPFEMLGWTVSPSVNYVTLLSDSIRSTDVYAQKSDYVFAGLSLSKSF